MSQQVDRTELQEQSKRLMNGPLKHIRAAALAALLVPLAAVASRPAAAQGPPSGGIGPTVPSPCDFVTSGGFVNTDGGRDANFGAHGGCKHDGFWGHINYVDHTTGLHVDSVQITGYLTTDPPSLTRDICGIATTNGPDAQVYFRVRLIDNGEPGTSDLFGIRLSNGYVVSTRLLNSGMGGGGNIQLHDPNPSTAGPSTVTDEATMCNNVEAP